MGSSRVRRKARRYLHSENIEYVGTRFKTGRVRAGPVPVVVRLLDAIRRDRAEKPLLGLSPAGFTVPEVMGWTNPMRRHLVQAVIPCGELMLAASERAERSRVTTRRKRGLRKGKRRSRVCQTRRIRNIPGPATSSKPQSDRNVNHIGRKFLWAVKASNRYRKACKKYISTDPSLRRPGYRRSLEVWWQHLADRARISGVPHQAAFHGSWWDYMRIEVHWDERARRSAAETLEEIAAVLPRREDASFSPFGELFGTRPEQPARPTDSVGNSVRTDPVAVCRHCRGLAASPGYGFPFGCRRCGLGVTPRRGSNRGRVARGRTRGRGRMVNR
jgi:hypothetical protein